MNKTRLVRSSSRSKRHNPNEIGNREVLGRTNRTPTGIIGSAQSFVHDGLDFDRPSLGAQLADIVSACDGRVQIDFPGNKSGPRSARSTVPLRNLKDKVLFVILPDNEPLIVGQVYDWVPVEETERDNRDVSIKGRRVRIESESEIVLISGSTKIHLDARGKVVTSADQVVSRARSTNKIQGGSVQIN